jgi:acetyltransferase-like isoleucine patch superfamily enzyme
MNNGYRYNPIGRNQPCYVVVDKAAVLTIGNNVGISSTAIVCHNNIAIGDNVRIGGGTCIYDSDFHSLDITIRLDAAKDRKQRKTKPVVIGNNVFIGAHVTILKGVDIGDDAIIGACAVVTKSVPKGEMWAGNPARCISK